MKKLKYIPHILFLSALAYFALLAFVLDKDPMMNKMIMVMICGLWVLWIFAKTFIKVMMIVVLLAVMGYAGYYIVHAEEIECKKAGREWNAKERICEDKKTMSEKFVDSVRSILKQFKEETAKQEEKAKADADKEKKDKDKKEKEEK